MVGLAPAKKGQTGADSDPIVTRLANEDKVKWFRKPNLRLLYILLFPTCMGIELTSGFDSQMINALQIVPTWVTCKLNVEVLSAGLLLTVQQSLETRKGP
jgi:hypothetical protein